MTDFRCERWSTYIDKCVCACVRVCVCAYGCMRVTDGVVVCETEREDLCVLQSCLFQGAVDLHIVKSVSECLCVRASESEHG